MTALYPLRFEPILRRYLWGGRRLETVLGKALADGDDYAESWEVCDRGADQSIVAYGPLKGTPLGELVRLRGRELLGLADGQPRFPLLIKFLDAHQKLSVQVHPDDARGARLTPPDLGKTEAWVVLSAEPGSVIYAGLKRGFDRAAVERELARGTVELCLHKFKPRAGDCVFLPAGTVHALGEGLVIAEVQQSSDVTYRLFDWNRVGADGKPRSLHLEESLEAIDFDRGPVGPITPEHGEAPGVERLVACDKFVLERWQIERPTTIVGDDRARVLMVLDGQMSVAGDPGPQPARRGTTVLVPASMAAIELMPASKATVLCAHLP
jgi:mannose-6-phosphate isomerase